MEDIGTFLFIGKTGGNHFDQQIAAKTTLYSPQTMGDMPIKAAIRMWAQHVASLNKEIAFHTRRLRFAESQLRHYPYDQKLKQMVQLIKVQIEMRRKMVKRATALKDW